MPQLAGSGQGRKQERNSDKSLFHRDLPFDWLWAKGTPHILSNREARGQLLGLCLSGAMPSGAMPSGAMPTTAPSVCAGSCVAVVPPGADCTPSRSRVAFRRHPTVPGNHVPVARTKPLRVLPFDGEGPPSERSGPPLAAPEQCPQHHPNLLNPGPKNLADRFLIFPGQLKLNGAP
jgi:hypothetical protein